MKTLSYENAGKIEARAKVRFAREQSEYEAKISTREAKTKATGKNPGGQKSRRPKIQAAKNPGGKLL